MARPLRLKRCDNGIAYYHLMSRTNDKRLLFTKGAVKTCMIETLRRAATFSGIRLCAYAALDNHFHVICEVTRGEDPVPPDELVRRYAVLKGERAAKVLAKLWRDLATAGMDAELAIEYDRLRRRMNDISEFMKTFKEMFDREFKRVRRYYGSIWSGRFKSTMIESGEYLSVCKRYVLMNPVRAGLVAQVKDYHWAWSEDVFDAESASFDARVVKRLAQISDGEILGSREFVRRWLFGMGSRLKSTAVAAYRVADWAYSSHGWRLAKTGA